MDYNLLLKLFKIPSRSHQEEVMSGFVEKQLTNLKVWFKKDKIGNLSNLTCWGAPLLSAHMDSVQDEIDVKLIDFAKIRGELLSGYGVIGADDKCGIYIILDLLKKRKFNFVFSVGEEAGGIGIRSFIEDNKLKGITYGLVLDRRGSDDIICTKNDYGTPEFQARLEEIGSSFGYSSEFGTFSDADYLSRRISVANLSVGYYNAHQKSEFVSIKALENARNFVLHILENLNTYFAKPKKRLVRGFQGYLSQYNDDDLGYSSQCNDDDLDDFVEWRCTACGTIDYDVRYIDSIRRNLCLICIRSLKGEIDDILPHREYL